MPLQAKPEERRGFGCRTKASYPSTSCSDSQFGKVSFLRQVTLGLSEKVALPNSPPDANLGEGHAGQRDSKGMVVRAWCSWDPLTWDMGHGTPL